MNEVYAALHDTDYRRIAGELLERFQELAPPGVVAVNVAGRELSQVADAGKWGTVCVRLDWMVEQAQVRYAETP